MPDLHAKQVIAWYPMSAEEMADYNIISLAPEPTRADLAIEILAPHLAAVSLYQPDPA